MEISFVPAGPPETGDLIVLMDEYAAAEGDRFDGREARRALEEIFSCPDFNRVWLIRDAREAVGYLVLTLGHSIEYGGRDAFIDELYVRKSHRGRGIGTRALETAQEAAAGLRVNALHLEVGRDNTAALRLYRRWGFEEHDRMLMTKKIPGQPK